jgi:transcription antitermination factor NusG
LAPLGVTAAGTTGGTEEPACQVFEPSPWLLVRTKPKQEAIAEQALRVRGLPVYCPRVVEPPAHARAPRGPVPLFPSYVFCRATPEDGLAAATYCPGVRRLVRFGERFAALRDADVDRLRACETDRGHLVVPTPPFEPGITVRLAAGPLSGLEAVVDRPLPSGERIRLLLTVASGSWHAIVPARDVIRTGSGPG